jgi:hypothetical protein
VPKLWPATRILPAQHSTPSAADVAAPVAIKNRITHPLTTYTCTAARRSGWDASRGEARSTAARQCGSGTAGQGWQGDHRRGTGRLERNEARGFDGPCDADWRVEMRSNSRGTKPHERWSMHACMHALMGTAQHRAGACGRPTQSGLGAASNRRPAPARLHSMFRVVCWPPFHGRLASADHAQPRRRSSAAQRSAARLSGGDPPHTWLGSPCRNSPSRRAPSAPHSGRPCTCTCPGISLRTHARTHARRTASHCCSESRPSACARNPKARAAGRCAPVQAGRAGASV